MCLTILVFTFSSLLLFFLSLMVLGGGVLFSQKNKKYNDKMSPFECGFYESQDSHLHFSLSFFLLSLIFLMFDIELVLLFPILMEIYSAFLQPSEIILFFWFLSMLTFSLLWEWKQEMLCWKF